MNEKLFHELMTKIHDLAGLADMDHEIAWQLPMLVTGAIMDVTAGTPAAEWAARWKRGEAPQEVNASVMTGPTEHYIGWCPDCQDHRMSSQCRQMERISVTQISPDVQQEYTHYWACATCGAAIHELPPF